MVCMTATHAATLPPSRLYFSHAEACANDRHCQLRDAFTYSQTPCTHRKRDTVPRKAWKGACSVANYVNDLAIMRAL